jgi:cytochrome d ubiquinol oxidase subunit I
LFFFLEAIFAAIYLYGWRRLSGWAHFWSGMPIALSGIFGAMSVVAVNSWMNQPGGFTERNGRVVSADPWQVFFNHAATYEMPHMILAAYMVILTPIQFVVGDTAARAIAHDQPVKFATMEYVPNTSDKVPEWLGGVYVNGHIYGGIRIPWFDSILVGFSPNTKVTGWNSVPASQRPPAISLIHLAFDVMVALGSLLLLGALWAAFTWWRKRRLPMHRVFWIFGAVSGLAAVVAMESGWVVTEVGRQPWIVYRVQTTTEAATANGGVVTSLSLIAVVYAVLGISTIVILRRLSARWRRTEGELEPTVPYGPARPPRDVGPAVSPG